MKVHAFPAGSARRAAPARTGLPHHKAGLRISRSPARPRAAYLWRSEAGSTGPCTTSLIVAAVTTAREGAGMGYPRLTDEYKAALWERYAKGESVSRIARVVGRHPVTVAQFIRDAGGIRPPQARGSQARLSLAEREEISPEAGGGRVAAGDRRKGRACAVNDQPGGRPQRRGPPVPGSARGQGRPPAGAPPETVQAGGHPRLAILVEARSGWNRWNHDVLTRPLSGSAARPNLRGGRTQR